MSTIAEIACSRLVLSIINIEIIKIKNKTKKAPIGVTKDLTTENKTLAKTPDRFSEIGEMSAKNESMALIAPNKVLILTNLTLMESRGMLAIIIKKGTKMVPKPKRL